MQAQLILELLNALLRFVPQGTALWAKYTADQTLIKQIIAEDRKPTPEEWAALRLESTTREQIIDEAAAAAGR